MIINTSGEMPDNNAFNKGITIKRGFNQTPDDIRERLNAARERSTMRSDITKQINQKNSMNNHNSIDARKQIEVMKNLNRGGNNGFR